MGQYLIAPRRRRRCRSLAMLVGSVTRAADRVWQIRYAVRQTWRFFRQFPANWHCAAAFRDFAAALLTADPARGMKTPNSEPDGRREKTQSAAHLGRSSLWPGGGACAWRRRRS